MRASDQDRLSASQVSRCWRHIILSSPRLWTEFRCGNVALTQQYLMRSKSFPISVIVDSDSNFQAAIALKSVTDRLRSLTLRLSPSNLSEVVKKLGSPAPSLEHLELSAEPSFDERTHVPIRFLDSSAATLKSLYLNNIDIRLNLLEFPVLTHLTLAATAAWTFDMSQLFHVFASARLLQEVCVKFSGPTTPIPEGQVVQLPRMKKLSFSNTSGKFPERLLSFFDVPSVEKIELDIQLPWGDTRTVPDFLPPKLRNLPHLSKLDSLGLGVSHDHCDIRLSGPNGTMSIRTSHERPKTMESGLQFQSDWFGSLKPESIADVKDLTLLYFHGWLSVSSLLGNMPDGVRSLTMEQHETDVIQGLSPSFSGPPVLPRLESLTFLPRPELMRKHRRLTDMAQKWIFPSLTGMARARDQTGFRLSRVSSDCFTTFPRPDIESLKLYVSCVQLKTAEDSYSSDPIENHQLSSPISPPTITDPRDLTRGGSTRSRQARAKRLRQLNH